MLNYGCSEINKECEFPMTETQMAYLIGRNTTYEMGGVATHAYYEFRNELNINQFEKAFNELIKQQPMLRAIFSQTGKQIIMKEVPYYCFERADLSSLSAEEQKNVIKLEREKNSHYIFKEDQWPLFKIKVAKLNENTRYMFFSIDLLVADGGSIIQMLEDTLVLYTNPQVKLQYLKDSFKDFVERQAAEKDSEKYNTDKKYWDKKLKDFPAIYNVPAYSGTICNKSKFQRVFRNLQEVEFEKLKKIAYSHKVLPSVLFCTLYASVLSYWGNQPDIAISVTVSNKAKYNNIFRNVVGDYTTIMPLDLHLKVVTSENFWDALVKIQKTFMESYSHLTYTGHEFLKDVANNFSLKNRAVMPLVFTYISNERKNESLQKLMGETEYSISQTPQVYIDCQIIETNKGISISWDYAQEIWNSDIINQMFTQFNKLIDQIMDDDLKLSDALTLSDMEKEFINQYNNTDQEIPCTTLRELMEPVFKKYAKKIAVKSEGEVITYQELDNLSDAVSTRLVDIGIGAGDFIAVYAPKNIQTVVNIIGIIKSGAAYVPILPDYPDKRVKYILLTAECKAYIVNDEVRKTDINVMMSNANKAAPNDPAYIIFTSGSTGNPKGVVISNDAVCNTIIDINRKFEIKSSDNIIGISSFCFDLSVYDVFGAFSTGATLVLIADARNIYNIAQTVKNEHITVWNSVPAILDICIDELEKNTSGSIQNYWQIDEEQVLTVEAASELRVVMLSGDWISKLLPERIKKIYPNVKIYSLGGATEGSIWSIYYPVEQIDTKWKSIPYGVPLANQKFYVLNYKGDICPLGVEGELHIGGRGVAEGYLNDKEKTEAAFKKSDFAERLYCTGDYGILWKEGYIEFKGRKDNQVKLNGYRIELSEIENVILRHPAITNVAVVIRENNQFKKTLCAYIVADPMPTVQELIAFVKKFLPDYMVPHVYTGIDEIPLTVNGKVNKKLLPNPDENIEKKEFTKPQNEIERKIEEIWKNVMDVEFIGTCENFFEMGGDSLAMVKAVTKINAEFGIKIGFASFFQNPTIVKVSALVEELIKSETSDREREQ